VIYLDYNASTPLAPQVREAMLPFLSEHYGNPSSGHWAAAPAAEAVAGARARVAALLGRPAGEVIFTSGGTEAHNAALTGVFFSARGGPVHLVTSAVEHPAVLEPCRFLERLGAEVTRVGVDGAGLVDPEDVRRALRRGRPGAVLVSVMHANNEVGTIQPIAEIARVAHETGALLHSDAAQTVGKLPTRPDELGVDLLSVAGHKFYGPKGVGALWVREGVELEPFLHGAGHERGRRAGTENVVLDVGLGAAAELAGDLAWTARAQRQRDRLWAALQELLGDALRLNGHPRLRLPNTLNVSFLGRDGRDVLAALPRLAASTGSACHTGGTEPSPVLAAMGVPREAGRGAVRFSLGRMTTDDDVDAAAEHLAGLLGPARA
jgi:cysteine desulfurase